MNTHTHTRKIISVIIILDTLFRKGPPGWAGNYFPIQPDQAKKFY